MMKDLIFPPFNTEANYNEEFWKTYMKNEASFAHIKEVSDKVVELQELSK